MALRLNGSSSGYVELDAPAVAGSHTLTLPDGGGSSGQYLQTDGSGGLSWQTVTDTTTNLTRGTETSLTGTSVSFSSLPSGIRKIYLVIKQLSQTVVHRPIVQIGTGGTLKTTGYTSIGGYGASVVTETTGFTMYFQGAAYNLDAVMTLYNIGGNDWVCEHTGGSVGWSTVNSGGGNVSLSGELDIISIVQGSGTFDAGTVNIFYEV